jgi:hypothetical protein
LVTILVKARATRSTRPRFSATGASRDIHALAAHACLPEPANIAAFAAVVVIRLEVHVNGVAVGFMRLRRVLGDFDEDQRVLLRAGVVTDPNLLALGSCREHSAERAGKCAEEHAAARA